MNLHNELPGDGHTVSTVEAARILGCSEQTIRNAIERNPMLAKRDGRRWIMTRDVVERWAVARSEINSIRGARR